MLYRKQAILESPTKVAGGPSEIAADMSEGVEPEGPAPEHDEGKSQQPDITIWQFQSGQQPIPLELDDPSDLKDYISRDDSFIWVDLSRFTENTLREYARIFGFHPIGVRVTLAPWQPPGSTYSRMISSLARQSPTFARASERLSPRSLISSSERTMS